jgi:hypothetical protein
MYNLSLTHVRATVLTSEYAALLAEEFNRNPVINDEAAFDIYPRYASLPSQFCLTHHPIQTRPPRSLHSPVTSPNSDNNGPRRPWEDDPP